MVAFKNESYDTGTIGPNPIIIYYFRNTFIVAHDNNVYMFAQHNLRASALTASQDISAYSYLVCSQSLILGGMFEQKIHFPLAKSYYEPTKTQHG